MSNKNIFNRKLEEGTKPTRPERSESEATKGTNTTRPDPKIVRPKKQDNK